MTGGPSVPGRGAPLLASRGHVPGLDGIRGIAILLVAAHNMQMLDGLSLHGAARWWQYVLNLGWVGVTLFFVLSGHLIAGILMDSAGKPHAMRRFLARRALRIFPLYVALLLVVFHLLPWLGWQPKAYAEESPHQIWYWLYLSNFTEPLGLTRGALPHLWSLAVEEQFYLFLPWLILAWPQPRRVLLAAAVVTLLCMLLRPLCWWVAPHPEVIYHWTFFRMDALTVGVCTAAVLRDPQLLAWFQRHHRALGWAVLSMVLAIGWITRGYPRTSMSGQVWGYSALSLGFAYLVLVVAMPAAPHHASGARSPAWQRCLGSPLLRRAGMYSYGFYMVHKPLHDAFSPKLLTWLSQWNANPVPLALTHLLAMIAGSFVVAAASYHCFESTFLRLKDRLT